jgi:hypothetical protein
MATSTLGLPTIANAMVRYHELLDCAAERLAAQAVGNDLVAFRLPELSEPLIGYYGASDIGYGEIGSVRGHRVSLLDLMRNPGTRTTKTFASLSLVARAVRHIQESGQRLIIITPTSGNKGTALRDAVARAYAHGLAGPENLRIATLVPASSAFKMRGGPLSNDPGWSVANPVLVAESARGDQVKALARSAFESFRSSPDGLAGFTPWFTLALDNYRVADVVRAFVEAEADPLTEESGPRVHAHAVSSAFGLLGYHLGHQMLADREAPGLPVPARHPGFLLVQQLATPDMVLSLLKDDFSRDLPPTFQRDGESGIWSQDIDPNFPAVADDPDEQLDPTFYTSAPVTSETINPIIRKYGGTGIVVSRRECLDHYEMIGALLEPLGIALPADPSEIREWSLVKAFTGVLLAVERGLIAADADLVIHGSGFYTDALLAPIPTTALVKVNSHAEVDAAISAAARIG